MVTQAILLKNPRMNRNQALRPPGNGVWDGRYSMLDAWRGLAALGVVVFHLDIGSQIRLGQASVLVFFVISGYCITASAESCRRNRVGPSGYMWRRLRRIYPPYFFSLIYFLATRIWKLRSGMEDQVSHSTVAWIQNLTLTQWLSLIWHPAAAPFNNPTLFIAGYWSLNYEEQFYIVIGVLLLTAAWLRKDLLPFVAALAVPAFIWNLLYPSICYGFFLEYWVPFALGSLVFYRLSRIADSRLRICIDAGIICLLAFAIFKNHLRVPDSRSLYFEWIVVSGFSLLLLGLRRWDQALAASWLGRMLRTFGLTSYSLYLTQQCNLRASSMVASRLIRWGVPAGFEFLIRLTFICAIGAIFWYFCERPFLNKPLPARRDQDETEAASLTPARA